MVKGPSADLKTKSGKIAQFINACLPKGIGFGLFVFEVKGGGELFWLGNTDLQVLIPALEDLIVKAKKSKESEASYGSKTVH